MPDSQLREFKTSSAMEIKDLKLLSEAKIIQLISAISDNNIKKFLLEEESIKTFSLLKDKKIHPPAVETQFSGTEIRELQPLILKILEGYLASLIFVGAAKPTICSYIEESKIVKKSIEQDIKHREQLQDKTTGTN